MTSMVTIALTMFIIFRSGFFLIEANKLSFSVDLIHRDSPQSPFHDPSHNPSQRVITLLQRLFTRVNYFMSVRYSGITDIIPDNNVADYLMKISIGSPPVEILASADTGSDLIWLQCQPCEHCYAQKAPIFSPNTSSTYKLVSCDSEACKSLFNTHCMESRNTCQYGVVYGDLSSSYGEIATETVAIGSTSGEPISFPNTIFGCGHGNVGIFGDASSGMVGLGRGEFSLISQMGSLIGHKFSYCLVPYYSNPSKSSKMYFGDRSVVSGDGVVSTPIFPSYPNTFYRLKLEGISVGGKRLDFYNRKSLYDHDSTLYEEGNIIIDSGTSLTLLPPEFYNRVESTVKSTMKIQHVPGDSEHNLTLCYKGLHMTDFPIMIAHFKGADVVLNPLNTFVPTNEDTKCLAFVPFDGFVVFGNFAQMNFLVGYDLEKKTVSFKPTDCTKY